MPLKPIFRQGQRNNVSTSPAKTSALVDMFPLAKSVVPSLLTTLSFHHYENISFAYVCKLLRKEESHVCLKKKKKLQQGTQIMTHTRTYDT